MRYWGFVDASVTGGSADGGIDIISIGALAQVKFEAHQVGRPTLQRLVGASRRSDRLLLFFSGAGYAAPAIEYAEEMEIALFKFDLLGRMAPANGIAQFVLRKFEEIRQQEEAAMQAAQQALARQQVTTGTAGGPSLVIGPVVPAQRPAVYTDRQKWWLLGPYLGVLCILVALPAWIVAVKTDLPLAPWLVAFFASVCGPMFLLIRVLHPEHRPPGH